MVLGFCPGPLETFRLTSGASQGEKAGQDAELKRTGKNEWTVAWSVESRHLCDLALLLQEICL